MYITINISTPNNKKKGKTARGFAKLRRIIYIENKNQMIKDMDIPKMIKKVDYSEYEGRYDESVNDVLTTSPDNLSVDAMREYLYGYTFTEDYAKGEFPDEMSMDYWRDSDKGICDFEVDLPCYDRNNMPDDVWDTKGDEAFEVIDDILDDSMDEIDSIFDDNYCIDTLQERKILEAIDSTGDGISEETALCVTDVGQEYEYISRVFPYNLLEVARQRVRNGIDCLEFKPNNYGVERIYFDISRRFDVGYPMLE